MRPQQVEYKKNAQEGFRTTIKKLLIKTETEIYTLIKEQEKPEDQQRSEKTIS